MHFTRKLRRKTFIEICFTMKTIKNHSVTQLKGNGRTKLALPSFYKGDNLCDILSGLLHTTHFLKSSLSKRQVNNLLRVVASAYLWEQDYI